MFIAGSLLAFIGRRVLVARSPAFFGPSGFAATAFGLWYACSVGWATWKAPDWMLNYLVPAEQINLVVVHLVFIVCALLAAVSGHTLTAVCLQRGWTGRAFLVLLAGAVSLFGLWGLTLDRYVHVGTYAEYMAGTAALLPQSHLAPSINVLGVLHVFAFAIPAVLIWRSGQRLRAT